MTRPVKIKLVGDTQRQAAIEAVRVAPVGQVVTITKPNRTAMQNALLHKWFGEIANHYGDMTMMQVKGHCHMEYGVPIRLQDDVFAWVWSKTGAKLPYEKQCKYLASGELKISSAMNISQLSEYMTAMARDYRERGVVLTDPKMQGFEQ